MATRHRLVVPIKTMAGDDLCEVKERYEKIKEREIEKIQESEDVASLWGTINKKKFEGSGNDFFRTRKLICDLVVNGGCGSVRLLTSLYSIPTNSTKCIGI